jgi:hypothetical protein
MAQNIDIDSPSDECVTVSTSEANQGLALEAKQRAREHGNPPRSSAAVATGETLVTSGMQDGGSLPRISCLLHCTDVSLVLP